MGLFITLLMGAFILAGALAVRFVKNRAMVEQISIAVALGAMVVLLALDLIPEMLEATQGMWYVAPLGILGGLIVLKILDRFVPEHEDDAEPTEENVLHIGIVSAIAIILHNIIEGMAVYGMSADSLTTACLVALGVGLHNIPMGMLLYSTLKQETHLQRCSVLGSAILSTFVGGLLMQLLSGFLSEAFVGVLIAVTTGMLLYIILFELIPHLWHCKKHGVSLVSALLGAAIVAVSMLLG